MDAALQLLPKLEVLCLTDNALVRVDHLQHCTSLTHLVRGDVRGGDGGVDRNHHVPLVVRLSGARV